MKPIINSNIYRGVLVLIIFSTLIFGATLFSKETMPADKTVYDFNVKAIDGNNVSLNDYKGKVLLIVNVASKCGYTSQYKGLQALYEKYKDKGLVVLGFPCNQFGSQEPGTNKEIMDFCTSTYGVTFPMFDKINVNGDDAHPLYKYLTEKVTGLLGTKSIKWNFTKFLIDKNGIPIDRYGSMASPEGISEDIEKLLNS
jgi:glutathione peroxidase